MSKKFHGCRSPNEQKCQKFLSNIFTTSQCIIKVVCGNHAAFGALICLFLAPPQDQITAQDLLGWLASPEPGGWCWDPRLLCCKGPGSGAFYFLCKKEQHLNCIYINSRAFLCEDQTGAGLVGKCRARRLLFKQQQQCPCRPSQQCPCRPWAGLWPHGPDGGAAPLSPPGLPLAAPPPPSLASCQSCPSCSPPH